MRILVAPLDWGMGHTTRCVPLIGHLRFSGHIPVFAGTAWQRKFIENIFPDIENIHIDGYNVCWDGNMVSFLRQIPHLTGVIQYERNWLKDVVAKSAVDGVISDNRFGLYHTDIASLIITHQLQPLSGIGLIGDSIVRKINYHLLGKFDKVWVADLPAHGLAGRLSHPALLPVNTEYIGLLSSYADVPPVQNEDEGSLLALLSGPEPQRSILSALLKEQLRHYKGRLVIVEGTDGVELGCLATQATCYGRLTPQELLPLLMQAEIVISRSGYSTIMDLIALNKRAILIPTPGQTEQEYLGAHLMAQQRFHTVGQSNFDLLSALGSVRKLKVSATFHTDSFQHFIPVLEKWTEGL